MYQPTRKVVDLQYFEYSSDPMEMDDNNDVRCSICQELLDKRDLVYALPSCMHIFHVQYLLRRAWKRETKCPNCRWQY